MTAHKLNKKQNIWNLILDKLPENGYNENHEKNTCSHLQGNYQNLPCKNRGNFLSI